MSLYDLLGGEQKARIPAYVTGNDIEQHVAFGFKRVKVAMPFGPVGGPPLFTDKYGPPMLRRRHFPAKITAIEAEGWLICFRQAWAETISDPALTAQIMPRIEALGQHMINAGQTQPA